MIKKPFQEWARDLELEIVLNSDGIYFFQWTLED
jgi:hypothetical protein